MIGVLFYFHMSLVSGGEVGGVCPGVVHSRVSQVVGQVLDRSLSGHDSLNEESEHREHSQPSVLQLLHLQLGEGVWVLSQVQGVE
ncbi:hypothetical protein Mapa_014194 [Marchantia paleacea]|nr:hypothetical protein Mapa_014194 [Marchantia paleacea]